jgi:acid phosphatase family membrane protein YuiD
VFRGEKPAFRNALQSGGMPSSHTAAAASMTLVSGFSEGFTSSVFALGLVLTAVVAHDAVRVRGAINTIIKTLKVLAPPELLTAQGKLPDTVGHSVGEVAAGFVLSVPVALVCRMFLI